MRNAFYLKDELLLKLDSNKALLIVPDAILVFKYKYVDTSCFEYVI